MLAILLINVSFSYFQSNTIEMILVSLAFDARVAHSPILKAKGLFSGEYVLFLLLSVEVLHYHLWVYNCTMPQWLLIVIEFQ